MILHFAIYKKKLELSNKLFQQHLFLCVNFFASCIPIYLWFKINTLFLSTYVKRINRFCIFTDIIVFVCSVTFLFASTLSCKFTQLFYFGTFLIDHLNLYFLMFNAFQGGANKMMIICPFLSNKPSKKRWVKLKE